MLRRADRELTGATCAAKLARSLPAGRSYDENPQASRLLVPPRWTSSSSAACELLTSGVSRFGAEPGSRPAPPSGTAR